jgi:hypothetical protein
VPVGVDEDGPDLPEAWAELLRSGLEESRQFTEALAALLERKEAGRALRSDRGFGRRGGVLEREVDVAGGVGLVDVDGADAELLEPAVDFLPVAGILDVPEPAAEGVEERGELFEGAALPEGDVADTGVEEGGDEGAFDRDGAEVLGAELLAVDPESVGGGGEDEPGRLVEEGGEGLEGRGGVSGDLGAVLGSELDLGDRALELVEQLEDRG